MKRSRFMCVLVSLLAVSCADSGGPVGVDAQWSLTCPDDVGCTTPAETCLGQGNQRAIVGQNGQGTCTDDPIIASCEAVERDGTRLVFLEANVGDAFAFELRGARIDPGGAEETACAVTIVESGDAYGRMLGACGEDPPSMVQPCQLSEISATGGEVGFDLECDALLSSTTGFGFDVRGTFRFSNCTGL
jgi:hypothetical protein